MVHPFAPNHEGPGFNPQGGTYYRDSPVSVVSLQYYMQDKKLATAEEENHTRVFVTSVAEPELLPEP